MLDVVLLCHNERNNGALRLLRTAYEKVVTAHYLWLKPESASDFVHFENFKEQTYIDKLSKFGVSTSPEGREQAAQRAQTAKSVLNMQRCTECGNRNHTWTKVTVEQMAQKTASYLSALITDASKRKDFETRFLQLHFYCWDLSTQLIHSTIKGMDLELSDSISPGMVLYSAMELMRATIMLRHTALQPSGVDVHAVNQVLSLLTEFDYDEPSWIN